MKRIFILLATVLLIATLWAQSPEKMSYQAVIFDNSDQLVSDTQIGMQISIVQGTVDGIPAYVETQSPTTNINGLVSVEIGGIDATVVSGDFSTINWANGIYFIKTETDPTGGTNYTITGTSQLISVPYALRAKTAESVDNLNLTGSEVVFDGWDKDVTNDFDGKYSSLAGSPTNVSDFTNDAGYLTEFFEVDDDTINEIQDLQLVGNNLTITNNGTATIIDLSQYLDNTDIQLTEAEVDAYVDNNGYLEIEVDDDVTNEIQNLAEVAAINNSVNAQLKNVTDPTDAQDAATKAYVDALENKLNILALQVELNAGTSVSDLLNAGAIESNLIGLDYQGGKIVYIFQSDDQGYVVNETHGLIVASSDQGEYVVWDRDGNSITNALDTTLGAGNANTETIVSVQGTTESYAARVCADLSLEGYNDWYLPSKGELGLLYLHRSLIGGFYDTMYWSSTESNSRSYEAWALYFKSGVYNIYPKIFDFRIRPVRTF